MFVSDSFFGAQSATPLEKGECERERERVNEGNEMRSSESEWRDTKQFTAQRIRRLETTL